MGLFDDFDVDMDEVKEAAGFAIDDGTYDYTISEALTQNGTKNKPNVTFFIIKYDLDEAGSYWEWFTVAVDGDSQHKDAKQSLGFLKTRLLSLGFAASELNDIDGADLEGITGSLTLTTKKSAKGEFQNISHFTADTDEETAPEPEPEPDTKAADAAAKKRVAARQAARTAPSKEEEAPAAPARRRRAAAASDATVATNPFE